MESPRFEPLTERRPMTPFTEDELKAKVQAGYIVESPEEMTEGYKKALKVQLTVQADTGMAD